jgi:hypothetical protein
MMVFAILYCIKNNINFELYSKDSNFGYMEGWTDYFEPFCPNVHNKIHSVINYRPKIGNKITHLWQLKYLLLEKSYSLLYKKIKGFTFYTQDIWPHIIHYPFIINKKDTDILERCREIICFTWKYNQKTEKEIEKRMKNLNLPKQYVSLHIRRGDKATEYDYLPIEKYIRHIDVNCDNLFIATDDYSVVEYISAHYPKYCIYTLCKKDDKGYQQSDFQKMNTSAKNEHMIELFTTMEIINNSLVFIGSYTSNIGRFMYMRNTSVCSILEMNKESTNIKNHSCGINK